MEQPEKPEKKNGGTRNPQDVNITAQLRLSKNPEESWSPEKDVLLLRLQKKKQKQKQKTAQVKANVKKKRMKKNNNDIS